MMRTAFGVSFLMLLALGAIGGCSSKEVDDNASSGGVCDTYCAELVACDSTQSAVACNANCQGQFDSGKLGSGFTGYVNTCLKNKACAPYNAGTALGDCNDEAVAAGTPSGVGSSFCADLATKLAECSLTSISAADCSGRTKKYNDASINQAAACLEGTCATVVGCVNASLPAGSGTVPGGSGGSGGSGNTGGSGGSAGGPACPITCIDEATAQYCDSVTGQMMTANCAEEFAVDGFLSNGCTTDAAGSGCTVDGLLDQACADGAVPFAVCAGLSEADLESVYVGCFRDMNGAHTVIPCYADFLMGTEEMPTIDCMAADAACLPGAPGAGGAEGEGGAGGAM